MFLHNRVWGNLLTWFMSANVLCTKEVRLPLVDIFPLPYQTPAPPFAVP